MAMDKVRVNRPSGVGASRSVIVVPSRPRQGSGPAKGEYDPAPVRGWGQDYFVEWQLGSPVRTDRGVR